MKILNYPHLYEIYEYYNIQLSKSWNYYLFKSWNYYLFKFIGLTIENSSYKNHLCNS